MGTGPGKLGPIPGVLNRLDRRVDEIPEVTIHPAKENLELVLDRFGAMPRDNTDKRLATEVNNRTGEWKFAKPPDANRYQGEDRPDSDRDGLPDAFEANHGGALRLNEFDLHQRYENIEVYLNGLAQSLLEDVE